MYDMQTNVITDDDAQEINTTENDEVFMPEGWAEGDDLFADPSTWTGNADAQEGDTGSGGETNAEEVPPTTEETTDGGNEQEAEAGELPTTQQEAAAPRKLKFQATIDHNTQDVEIDESELPTLYQKAQNLDRAQERSRQSGATLSKLDKLAKLLEYNDTDDFFKGTVDNLIEQRKNELVAEGVHATVADRIARQDYADLLSDVSGTPSKPATPVPGRDFTAETQELLSKHPELGPASPVPNEVVLEAARPGGPTLLQAYESYLSKQKTSMSKTEKAELEALRKENKTLKQNAEAARRAPVTSAIKGGATKEEADDPFLKGFNSEIW